ncbi:VOC family protein [Klebsiella michiganensis]|uniref:VOC family protein n=1 Tax=Klebsiella michiganensis TaxID=1134687 RepID=UPI0013D25812|nr:VOC family protein [Klebsiella michiganensis]
MQIHAITIDTVNPQMLATWWSDVLGIPIANDYGLIVQLAASSRFPPIQFQKIEQLSTVGNHVHLDLSTKNLDEETERLVKMRAEIIKEFKLPQIRYTSFYDPDGNKFDVVENN